MVVFTCQHCGDSLKKPAVEKHYRQTKCRIYSPSLTCVDCLKDFFDIEYNTHTSCLTEAQRYSAKGTVIKEAAGKQKQQKYVEIVQKLLNTSSLTYVQKDLLKVCSSYDNVPQKEKKFLNFIGNVARAIKFSNEDAISVFKLLNDAWKNETKNTNTNASTPSKVVSENGTINIVNDVLGHQQTKHKSKDNPSKRMQIDEVNANKIDENVDNSKENLNVISKKDSKKQKKYEKYLKKLEQTKSEGDDTKQVEKTLNYEDEMNENSYKKSKVTKTKKVKPHTGKNDTEEVTNVMQSNKETNSKKCKKRKLDDVACEDVVDKKKKTTLLVDLEDQSKPFNWTDTIKQVLQAKVDKELSLKRLGKKVIDEYQTVRSADHRTYEELLAKFNKKIKKTKGVQVLKDKAKLIE